VRKLGDMVTNESHSHEKSIPPSRVLVGAEECIRIVFPTQSRPHKRTFLEWKARRLIPFYKIGRRIFFDPEEVRTALDRHFRITDK
jgi:hypothetical protein